jgi:DNA-binding response OmpR family regulator
VADAAPGRAAGVRRRPVVLLVDDDAAIRRTMTVGLELEGFDVVCASGGRAALEAVKAVEPAVMLLDLTMPDLDGLEVLERLRGAGDDLPVCVLSAREQVSDRVRGLEAGADDYVVKPFALEEVSARLHALLRRRPLPDGRIVAGDIELDPAGFIARRGGRDLGLTRREFELLQLFVRHPGEVLDRRRLHEEVWRYTFDPGTNVTDVFVGYLRRKLEADGEPRVLHTVRGVGFVLRP